MASKRVLFLTSGRIVPSSRFRVQQFLPQLKADGWDVTVAPCVPNKYASRDDYPGGFVADALLTLAKLHSRFWSSLRAGRFDVVYIERELLPHFTPAPEEFLRLLNPNIIFDFDDAIFLRYAHREVNPVAQVLKLAKTVICGNEFLGEWALRHNDNVWVLPTAVDTDRYTPTRRIGSGRILVWTGSSSNLRFLEPMKPALQLARTKWPDLLVRIVCDRPPSFDLGAPVEFIEWNVASEVEAVRTADIGIMPLPNDEWTQGKCGYKLLQYMACGLPSISAPYGIISDMIDAGTCGLAAQDTEEWLDSLERLVDDKELRRLMGEAARYRAETIYSVKAVYPRWHDVLEMQLPSNGVA
jgi:glycosyltransferase involved in cell wall biosynthesis